ncbi:MAG TPA: hypothetical protein VJ140_02090, partial [Actinomycetota bacterium]|nr:hypothetical protein [Actinomycetota bacterium]
MERERTTIADYRGYLRRHVAHPVPTPPRQGAISRRSVRDGFPSVPASAWRGGQPALGVV